MSLTTDQLSQLTTLIYGAASDSRCWDEVLRYLHELTGARPFTFGQDMVARRNLGGAYYGYDREVTKQFEDYFSHISPWSHSFARMRPGEIATAEELCPTAEIERTEFYNDWVRPNEDIVGGAGMVVENASGRFFLLGGNLRRKEIDSLQAPWVRVLGLIRPHVRQAMELQNMLVRRDMALTLREMPAAASTARLLLDETGYLLEADTAAQRALEEGAVLRRSGFNRVEMAPKVAPRVDLPARLGRLRAAQRLALTDAGGQGWEMRLFPMQAGPRAEAALPHLFRWQRNFISVTLAPRAAPDAPEARLRREKGLSPREAAVCLALARGRTVEEIAAAHDVRAVTVRNQIKSAMSKMELRRQVDLVRVVLSYAD